MKLNCKILFKCSTDMETAIKEIWQTEFSYLKLGTFNRLLHILGLLKLKETCTPENKIKFLEMLNKKS